MPRYLSTSPSARSTPLSPKGCQGASMPSMPPARTNMAARYVADRLKGMHKKAISPENRRFQIEAKTKTEKLARAAVRRALGASMMIAFGLYA